MTGAGTGTGAKEGREGGSGRVRYVEGALCGLDAVIRNPFFDLMASVVLPGSKDVSPRATSQKTGKNRSRGYLEPP